MKNFLLAGTQRRGSNARSRKSSLPPGSRQTLSKDKILELYLNEIFLGQNSYGVAAAAQTYFNKSLADLAPARGRDAGRDAAGAGQPMHPVPRRTGQTERRNYVLREMWQNGYIDEATYLREKEQPLRSVQNGDFERSAMRCRRATISPTKSAASCRAPSARTNSSRRPDDPRHRRPRPAGSRRRRPARGAGEIRPRPGVWRGTGKTIPPSRWAHEAAGARRLPVGSAARHAAWFPAVVLEVGESDARIGIEGVDGRRGRPFH